MKHIYTHNFLESQEILKKEGEIDKDQPPDLVNHCLKWWTLQYLKKALLTFFDTSAAFMNEAIAYIFKNLGEF